MVLAGCAQASGRVYVRARNDGPWPIANLWLGAGGPRLHSEAYGAVGIGETTRYHGLKPILAKYRKTNVIVSTGRQYWTVIYPERQVGRLQLEPGHYTFVYRIVGEQLQVTILRDSPQVPPA